MQNNHETYLAVQLRQAAAAVDEVFGEGYAARDTALVGAVLQASVADEAAHELQTVLALLEETIETIGEHLGVPPMDAPLRSA